MPRRSDKTQHLLFEPALSGIESAVKAAMRQAVKDSPYSREQVVDRMNALASSAGVRLAAGNGSSLSLATFEKWLNPGEADHMPSIRALGVFCKAAGTAAPLEALAETLGFGVVDERGAKLLEWAEHEMQIKRLQQKKRRIEADL